MLRYKEFSKEKTEKYLKALSLGVDGDERILKVVHLHPIFFLKIIAIFFLFGICIPIGAFYYLNFIDTSIISSLDDLGKDLILVGFLIYFVTILTFSYITWIDDYFDTGIITNRRVVDIDQTGLFGRKITQIYFENIQDATAKRTTIWQNIFNYGTVNIQSGGEKVTFYWKNIPKAFEVAGFMLELKNKRFETTPDDGMESRHTGYGRVPVETENTDTSSKQESQ
jgi:hypothetical protein